MLSGRHDIIGDLARLRNEFVGASNRSDDALSRLEVLAATAVFHGMSYAIVTKASGVPRRRIEVVAETQVDAVASCAAGYERLASGLVMPIERTD
ncbi:MAG: hypothetical protein OES24_18870 [Acidimicrobiia bacterium]|nr:hypothetical protein [Acidimicrobiia bacterium]